MRKCLLILFFAFAAAGASAAQIDTVAVFSAKMQREIPALVVVPDAGVGRRMPVLYLLHGADGNHNGCMVSAVRTRRGRTSPTCVRWPTPAG